MEQNNSLPSLDQLRTELDRENYRSRYGSTVRSTFFILVVVAAVSILLATLVFPVFTVLGDTMAPTLENGDVIVAVKGLRLKSGDVIVVSYNNQTLIKRVVAESGQMVDMDSSGSVWVNGEKLDEPYLSEKAQGNCTIELPYPVPEQRYFVLGDNRPESIDSRNSLVGSIADEQVIGKAVLRIWPFSGFGRIA